MTRPTKFDPGPLIEASGGEVRGLARRLGISAALLCRPLTVNQADKYAIAIGIHPVDVWGAEVWWGDDLEQPPRREP